MNKKIIFLSFVFVNMTNFLTAQTVMPLQKLAASDRSADAVYGWASSIYGNYAIVGSPEHKENLNGKTLWSVGAAYILEKDVNGKWKQLQELKATNDTASFDWFGGSVSMFGDYALVGADGDGDVNNEMGSIRKGAAYVYKKDKNNRWQQTQKIILPNRGTFDIFGNTLAISDKYAVISAKGRTIGAPYKTYSGEVFIYKKDANSEWKIMQVVQPPVVSAFHFGEAVAISDNNLVIGCLKPAEVFAYQLDKTTDKWMFSDSLKQDYSHEKNFGEAVSCNENYMFVGAGGNPDIPTNQVDADTSFIENADGSFTTKIVPRKTNSTNTESIKTSSDSNTTNNTGVVYVYKKESNRWHFYQKLEALDKSSYSCFGMCVSVSNGLVLIGAMGNLSDSVPVITANECAGAAYLFQLNKSGKWEQEHKFILHPRLPWTKFGFSVGIYKGELIIGSRFDSTDAQGKNPINNAGAVYIYNGKKIQKSNFLTH